MGVHKTILFLSHNQKLVSRLLWFVFILLCPKSRGVIKKKDKQTNNILMKFLFAMCGQCTVEVYIWFVEGACSTILYLGKKISAHGAVL